MKVIFAHGQESGPWGFKIKRMAPLAERHGCEVESVDYRDCPDHGGYRPVPNLSKKRSNRARIVSIEVFNA